MARRFFNSKRLSCRLAQLVLIHLSRSAVVHVLCGSFVPTAARLAGFGLSIEPDGQYMRMAVRLKYGHAIAPMLCLSDRRLRSKPAQPAKIGCRVAFREWFEYCCLRLALLQ